MMTKRVYGLTPMTSATILAPASAPVGSPIPQKVGGPSPIKYVFYIIRENRTYDQILGDLEKGNGDPNLCLFGEDVTPNAHAIAREFVVLDNFYVDAEVSYDGHAYSTGAYATDFVEKIWPTNYGGRGARYLSEGGGKMRNAYGNVTAPLNGYIWDACNRANVSVRSYGEFAQRGPEPEGEKDSGVGQVVATVPGLKGKVHPNFMPYDLTIPDNKRVDVWLEEFKTVRAVGRAAAPEHHPARQRPHRGHARQLPDAARDGRRERRRARPRRRGDHQQSVLEGVGDLRPRRRRAGGAGPRGHAPLDRAGGEPVHQARQRGLDALHHVGDAPDDRADPRPAADEQPGRGRDADVRRVPVDPGADALRPPSGAHRHRRRRTRRTPGARTRRRGCTWPRRTWRPSRS